MKSYENYDPLFPDQPVVDRYLPIWADLPAFAAKPAFIWAGDDSTRTSITYAELHQSVQSISTRMSVQVKRGEPVVILCPPGLELVEIILACQRSGLLSVPVSPPDLGLAASVQHQHLVRVLTQTNPKVAVSSDGFIQNVRRYVSANSEGDDTTLSGLLKKLTWVSTETLKSVGGAVSLASNEMHYDGCGADDVYLIQYTSGATGIPKPVLITAGSAAHNVRTARKAYDLHPNSVIVSWLPQYKNIL
uniref:AMP-dependent synthetase/ligase domain-containing protein n=1 Tax=Kalanchoe fedtschenkoi TaxID=63787 RepID=A0A7N0ZTK0_KALFE